LVGLLGGAGDQSSAKASTYTGQHNTEKHRHTSITRAGFEPVIPMFERPKTVLALDRSAIETEPYFLYCLKITQYKYWDHRQNDMCHCLHCSWTNISRLPEPFPVILLSFGRSKHLFGAEYKLWSSSSCKFLYFPIALCLLVPNFLLTVLRHP
jgi:hypothetical protein